MKILKYISIVMVLIVAVTQCKLPDNVDPKNPTEVPIETLFSNAELALLNHVDRANVNNNTYRLYVQYWQETTYFDESRYLFQDRQIPDNVMTITYRNSLMDLKQTKMLLADWGGNETERDNKIAIATILEVYAWSLIVDTWGDMPYSEALLGAENSTPAYDDAAGIYTSIMGELGIAISMLKPGTSYGGADFLFGGDIASWKSFAGSLQLRLGMRLADVNSGTAKSAVEAALVTGVFTDVASSALLHYNGVVPHVNTIYQGFVVDNRKDYLPTATIIDLMIARDDPRLPLWFTQVDDGTGTMIYLGAVPGLDGAQTYANFSNFTPVFFTPTFPAIIQDYVEVEFLLAEAVERGYVAGDAETHYNNAIAANILYWGGSQADVDTYLAHADVAYATAAGDYKEKIGTQMYIALYNRGIEGWNQWKRFDFPVLSPPEGMTQNDIPKRFPYPYNEKLENGANYNAAKALLPGGVDDHRSKVFWDVN